MNLVNRLRDAIQLDDYSLDRLHRGLMKEAADEIEQLRGKLREILYCEPVRAATIAADALGLYEQKAPKCEHEWKIHHDGSTMCRRCGIWKKMEEE